MGFNSNATPKCVDCSILASNVCTTNPACKNLNNACVGKLVS